MAAQPQAIDIDNPYRQEDYDFGPLYLGAARAPTWTDGLPHHFKGWGPQTADPEGASAEGVEFQSDNGLSWGGDSDERAHHVWRFDGRRRQTKQH